MTKVVCCYGTETESEAGDSAREQDLVELLPAEGGISRSAPARGRSHARGRVPSRGELRGTATTPSGGLDADDEYSDTTSDEDEGDDASRGAMMRPAAPLRSTAADDDGGSPVRLLVMRRALVAICRACAECAAAPAQAQRMVQRLHERPQRRSRALARALAEAAAVPAGAVAQAALPSGDAQALMVPLFAPGRE